MGRRSDASEGADEMVRETVSLPPLPAGAPDDLRLRRDFAVAAMVIRNRCSIQEACDQIDQVLSAADELIKRIVKP